MMNKNTITHRSLMMLVLASAVVPLVQAQAVKGVMNAATQVQAPATPVPPPPPPPPPAASAAAAAQGAAAATVRAPMGSAGAANAAANTAASGSVSRGVNANATTHASAQGQAHGLAVAHDASQKVSVTANPADEVAHIKETTFAQRDKLTADIESRLDASANIAADVEAKASQAEEKSRAMYAKLLVDIRAREKALRTSLREANKTTREKAWGEIQSELAKNYGAYAEVVARAEAAVATDAEVK